LYQDFLSASRSNPDAAAKLVGSLKFDGIEPAEASAWIALARTILNLDEFVTRE
jgi:hypothetical protein